MKRNRNLFNLRLLGLQVFFAIGGSILYGQSDSVNYNIEFGSLYSEQEHLPLYLHSNVGGVYDYNFNGPYLRAGFSGSLLSTKTNNLRFGADLVLLNQENAVNLQQFFLEYDLGVLAMKAGRWELDEAGINSISVGNFGITNNAQPIPKIGIFMDDYWELPVLNGFVSFKGELFHGWMEEDRFISSSWLHGKSGYLRFGDDKISFTGGLNHYVIWAGQDSQSGVQFDRGLNEFWSVFIGNGLPDVIGGEGNGLGSHLGFWEFIAKARIGEFDIELNNQSQFEDGRSSQYWNLDLNRDRKVALNIASQSNSFLGISQLLLEYMTTTFQQGPGLPDDFPQGVNNFGFPLGGRDDTYNNYLYRDGWTYNDRVIGNALFIDRELGRFYSDNIPDYGVAIINNRIRAFHFGIQGDVKSFRYKVMSTFSKNFGTYSGLYEGRFNWEGIQTDPDFEYFFNDGLAQTYLLLEVSGKPFPKHKNLSVAMNLGIDRGEITNNLGFGVSLRYSNGFGL